MVQLGSSNRPHIAIEVEELARARWQGRNGAPVPFVWVRLLMRESALRRVKRKRFEMDVQRMAQAKGKMPRRGLAPIGPNAERGGCASAWATFCQHHHLLLTYKLLLSTESPKTLPMGMS